MAKVQLDRYSIEVNMVDLIKRLNKTIEDRDKHGLNKFIGLNEDNIEDRVKLNEIAKIKHALLNQILDLRYSIYFSLSKRQRAIYDNDFDFNRVELVRLIDFEKISTSVKLTAMLINLKEKCKQLDLICNFFASNEQFNKGVNND